MRIFQEAKLLEDALRLVENYDHYSDHGNIQPLELGLVKEFRIFFCD